MDVAPATARGRLPAGRLALICCLVGLFIGLLVGFVPASTLGRPELPLASSLGLLVAFAVWAWRREPRAVGGSLAALALASYFPLRGLLLLLADPTNHDGVNTRVLDRLPSPDAGVAAVGVLVISVTFVAGYALGLVLRGPTTRVDHPSPAPPAEERDALGSTALALLVVGCFALVVQATASLTFLRAGSTSDGALAQVWYGLVICAGLGVLAAPTNRSWPARSIFHVLLFLAFAIGVVAGSKDVIAQLLLALVLRQFLVGQEDDKPFRGARSRLLLPAVLLLVLFVVFPAVNSYRRSIQHGVPVVTALRRVPADLRDNTIVLGRPRQYRGPEPYAYDALLFVTNRLHGYDSLLLGISRGHDPEVLSARALVTSPLGALLPTRLVDPDNQDVGQLFAHKYWGLAPSNRTSVAIGVFTQMWIAFGWPMVAAAGLLVGLMAFFADELLAAGSVIRLMAGYALLFGVLAMERDAVFVVTSTARHLLVVLTVALLLRPLVERQPRRRPVREVATVSSAVALAGDPLESPPVADR